MVVKVIGRDEKLAKETTCTQCAAILSYVRNDREFRKYSCCGKPESGYFITCPDCQHLIEVS